MHERMSLSVSQEFSKWKVFVLGIVVEILTTSGVWSEVDLVREVSVEFGKRVLISVLRKTRSRRASVGFSRRLDQVKSRSNSGSSRRAREFIALLKSSVSR